jgi:hypothetical protein
VTLVGLSAIATAVYTYGNRYNGPPIRSDGFGYYLYLPAIFIHGDLHFSFIDNAVRDPTMSIYPLGNVKWAGLTRDDFGYTNKYPVGTALMQIPFFLASLAIAKFSNQNPTGFEMVFQYANICSSIFYLCLGSFILLLTAIRLTNLWVGLSLVSAAIFGTNVLFYGSYDGSFSHIYCFCLGSLVMYLVFIERERATIILYYGLLGAAIGLATIVRPTNLVWALLVLIGMPRCVGLIIRAMVAFSVGYGLLLVPQLAFWFFSTGNLVTYSYGDEGFNFLTPEMLNYLFSVRKGMFFWQPLYLLLSLGTIAAALKRRRGSILLLVLVVIADYINSSWRTWFFGGSFGSRPAVDTLPLLVIGSSLALQGRNISKAVAGATAFVVVLLVAANVIQMRGYIVSRIPFDGETWDGYVTFWRDTLPFPGR